MRASPCVCNQPVSAQLGLARRQVLGTQQYALSHRLVYVHTVDIVYVIYVFRPLPAWYDQAKVGIFLHWGLFSVPSYGGGRSAGEWFWENWIGRKDPWIVEFMQRNYLEDFTYPDFAPMFKAELFHPQKWVDLFERAGAKWVWLKIVQLTFFNSHLYTLSCVYNAVGT